MSVNPSRTAAPSPATATATGPDTGPDRTSTTREPDRISDAGQATAEYALVLLGAAAVALLLVGWATTTDQVSRLFDFVVDQVIGRSG
jgi:hypothetical protein